MEEASLNPQALWGLGAQARVPQGQGVSWMLPL